MIGNMSAFIADNIFVKNLLVNFEFRLTMSLDF